MIRTLAACLILVVALVPHSVLGQESTVSNEPLSKRVVSYKMDVSLNPETRTVDGNQLITWRNDGSVPVNELQFHMYLNAFQNERSTFMKESGGVHRGFSASGEDVWGGITISSMKRLSSVPQDRTPIGANSIEEDLSNKMEFIQPDDGNIEDETVMRVRLDRPVGPGETVALEVEFESKFPKIIARTGWEESSDGRPFFFAGQWFPKLGVYELPGQRYHPEDSPSGKWSTHQFHANSEFYSDFGTYDVSITTPESYTVGSSGVLINEQVADGFKTVHYSAADVHDFAWTASESYVEYTDTWQHVNLRLLLQPEHDGQQERHFLAAKNALEAYNNWVGEYPYTTLTLVDGIGGSNGMEYPTLITCGTYYNLPEWVGVPLELVTIHEFGHQYFYGLLASNEAEEAWLDEGMNSYVETRIMDTYYGKGSFIDIPGLRVDDGSFQRLGYTKSTPSRGALFTKSWEYKFGDYGKASYSKPATVMNTLERYLGWETMREFLQTYYDRWAFDHPTTRDIQQVAEDVSGEDLDWFF
ncbi:MAG: M1 family metallopeptidase, partial [Rhodothermales bacterium]|nr:M1 family metallopeptidase [Rhodothermales bacterium]